MSCPDRDWPQPHPERSGPNTGLGTNRRVENWHDRPKPAQLDVVDGPGLECDGRGYVSRHSMPLWTFGGAGIDGPIRIPRLVNVSTATVTQIGGVERCDVRGRTVAFRQLGAGPVVVLVHGLAGTMETWDRVIEDLSSSCTVVAMDLPGHGRSAAPAGDYSLEAYASCVRDLLDALGHRAATVVGHSLGGGVAMQFAHDYPERCERLVLVSSGGLGADVSIALRAAALPGSERWSR